MPFQKGNKLAGSRKGIPNKRSLEVRAIIEGAGFCPTLALIEGHKIAMARFVEELDMVESGRLSPMECSAPQYLKMALDCAKELAGYVNPKLKAIEQTKGPGVLDGMTDKQKLEAMRLAVKHMEAQVGE